MAFPTSKNDANGRNKSFGNAIATDENSNKGPSTTTKVIGVTKGRLTFSKQNISTLNTGVMPVRDDC